MKMSFTFLLSFLFINSVTLAAEKGASKLADKSANVFFVFPKAGEAVATKFKVKFGVSGMAVEKAGVMKPNTGHHHLIIDGGPVAKGQLVLKDETHKHFGDGQSEVELQLKPGKHTLTLQFADGAHLSYGPELSTTIEVNVK